MPSIEQQEMDEDALEDLLTTIPLLMPSSSAVLQEVTLINASKPNAIVRPIIRPVIVKDVPPVQDDCVTQLEQQIRRTGHENSGNSRSKHPAAITTVNAKRKLVPMDPLLHKPLFITTVPSGVFLEKSTEAVETRKVYNYSSAPRVIQNLESQSFLSKISASLTTKKSYLTSLYDGKSQRGIR